MRHAHYLSKNHATQLPSNCIWFDTETKPKIGKDGKQYHYLWFGYAVYQRRLKGDEWEPEQWLRFTRRSVFWEWVESRCRKKTRLYLFAHNGAFDLPVMGAFSALPERGWELVSAVADAPPLILTWKKDGMTIKFVDTLNIWRMPLSTLGRSIGHDKLPMPKPNAPRKEWDRYGKQDADVIRIACLNWFRFLRENDLGGFAPTLASQAYNAYRHRFMATPIFIDNNPKAIDLARRAYVGGRTECFKIGTFPGPLYYIDVNSMYPAVMVEGQYPTKLRGVYKWPEDDELERWCDEAAVMCDVEIETDVPAYPYLTDTKLLFPVGKFRTVLATPELKHALQHGHIVRAHRCAVYDVGRIFADYVNTIYNLRLQAKAEGRDVDSFQYKILLNSLYGKFGQRGRVYEEIDTCDPDIVDVWQEIDADTGEVTHLRQFGGIVQRLNTAGESRNSHPAIAAQVTSYARMKLWRAITTVGLRNIYYCDTDSMVVNELGYKRMKGTLDDAALGKWALEKTLSSVTLRGAKDYVMDGESKTKGVRASAESLGPNHYRQDHFVGLKGLLRLGSLEAPIVYSEEKKLTRQYTKGRVQPSGNVLPWRLPKDLARLG